VLRRKQPGKRAEARASACLKYWKNLKCDVTDRREQGMEASRKRLRDICRTGMEKQ